MLRSQFTRGKEQKEQGILWASLRKKTCSSLHISHFLTNFYLPSVLQYTLQNARIDSADELCILTRYTALLIEETPKLKGCCYAHNFVPLGPEIPAEQWREGMIAPALRNTCLMPWKSLHHFTQARMKEGCAPQQHKWSTAHEFADVHLPLKIQKYKIIKIYACPWLSVASPVHLVPSLPLKETVYDAINAS